MDQNDEFNPGAFLSAEGERPAPEAAPVDAAPAEPVPETPFAAPFTGNLPEDPAPAAPVPETPAYEPPTEQPVWQPPADPAPAAPEPPVYRPPVSQTADPYAQTGYAPEPQRPVAPIYPRTPDPAASDPRPPKKSAYAPMSSVGMAIQLFLMGIPVIGLILSIIWACGVCRKLARRNLARAYLILLILGILLTVAAALVLRFCFTDQLTRAFEQLYPGYTIHWG